jgi:hypothetical protein
MSDEGSAALRPTTSNSVSVVLERAFGMGSSV